MAKSLYDSYCSQVKWEVPIDRVRWHARVQFINKAYRVYIQQLPNVKETVRNGPWRPGDDVGLIDNTRLIEEMSREERVLMYCQHVLGWGICEKSGDRSCVEGLGRHVSERRRSAWDGILQTEVESPADQVGIGFQAILASENGQDLRP